MVGRVLVYNSYDLTDEVRHSCMFSHTFVLNDRVLVYNSYHLKDDGQHSHMGSCLNRPRGRRPLADSASAGVPLLGGARTSLKTNPPNIMLE